MQVKGTSPLSPEFLQALLCKPGVAGTEDLCCDKTSASPEPAEAQVQSTAAQDICTTDNCEPGTAEQCFSFINPINPPKNFYINGIQTSRAAAEDNIDTIESQFKQDVELIYNPTEGFWNDIGEAYRNISGYDTEISQQAEQRFRTTLDSGENIRVYAHSQGLAITADALRNVAESYRAEGKNAEEVKTIMNRVQVVSFGGFSSKDVFPEGTRTILEERPYDSVPELAERALELGTSFENEEWGSFGINLAKAGFTLGKVIVTNSVQFAGSAWGNRDKLMSGMFAKDRTVAKTNMDAFGSAVYKDVIDSDHGFDQYFQRFVSKQEFKSYPQQPHEHPTAIA